MKKILMSCLIFIAGLFVYAETSSITPVLDFSQATYFRCGFSSMPGTSIDNMQVVETYTITTGFDSDTGRVYPVTSGKLYAYWYAVSTGTVRIYMSVSGNLMNVSTGAGDGIPFKISFSDNKTSYLDSKITEHKTGNGNGFLVKEIIPSNNNISDLGFKITEMTIFDTDQLAADYFDYDSGLYTATITLRVVPE